MRELKFIKDDQSRWCIASEHKDLQIGEECKLVKSNGSYRHVVIRGEPESICIRGKTVFHAYDHVENLPPPPSNDTTKYGAWHYDKGRFLVSYAGELPPDRRVTVRNKDGYLRMITLGTNVATTLYEVVSDQVGKPVWHKLGRNAYGIRVPKSVQCKSGDTISVYRQNGTSSEVVLVKEIKRTDEYTIYKHKSV